jgi:hypothetical protein
MMVTVWSRGHALVGHDLADIERSQARALGAKAYQDFRTSLRAVVDSVTDEPGQGGAGNRA